MNDLLEILIILAVVFTVAALLWWLPRKRRWNVDHHVDRKREGR